MTEKRLYECFELTDGTWGLFKDKCYSDSDTVFFKRYCVVSTEEKARRIVNELNQLNDKYGELSTENQQLKQENKQLKSTLAYRSNQLALMEKLIDDLGSEEMKRQMEDILND